MGQGETSELGSWRGALNSTPSNFFAVSGVPSHSSTPTRSFMMVSDLQTNENTEPHSYVMLRRQILFQPPKEISGYLVVSNLDQPDPQLPPGRVNLT